MKYVGLSMLLVLLTSCNAIKVQYDYDKETDFSGYTTYNYYEDMDTGLSELDTKRLIRAIDSVMRTKAILLSEEPDFLIGIKGSTFEGGPNNTVGLGLGGGGRSVGGGVSVGIPVGRPKLERQIIFDLVDSQKDALFWQAVSKSPFKEGQSPEAREQKLQELVTKVFSKYPVK